MENLRQSNCLGFGTEGKKTKPGKRGEKEQEEHNITERERDNTDRQMDFGGGGGEKGKVKYLETRETDGIPIESFFVGRRRSLTHLGTISF